MSTVWIVIGEHPFVGGTITSAYASEELANGAAAELVNIMLNDTDWPKKATPHNWPDHVKDLQDFHGAQFCNVEVLERKIHS